MDANDVSHAQTIADLGLDRGKVNVNGGAVAIGHPLSATGVRRAPTLARELIRSKSRYGVATGRAGGGQGVGSSSRIPLHGPPRGRSVD